MLQIPVLTSSATQVFCETSRAAAATLPCVIAVELSVRKLAVPPLLAALPDMIKLIYGINLIDVIAAEEVDRMA